MDQLSTREQAVADFLQTLKERSGRTYDGLARRSGLSRSTVHRYCHASSLPDVFGPLEALAVACGAGRGEIAELFRLWSAAKADDVSSAAATALIGTPRGPRDAVDAASRDEADPGTGPAEASPGTDDAAPGDAQTDDARSRDVVLDDAVPGGAAPADGKPADGKPADGKPADGKAADGKAADPVLGGASAAGGGVRRRWSRRGVSYPVVVSAVVLLVAYWWIYVSVPALPRPSVRNQGGEGIEQRVEGPTWESEPKLVSPDFFGVTMNSTTGQMPSFKVGSVRFWDSHTGWADLEPARGSYHWETLDRLVEGAQKAGLPTLFTLGGTPGWAAPQAPRMAYENGARAAPPDDLKDWDDFVTALAHRYAGRIQAYELWVLAPSPLYYSGSAATLVAMTDRAATILRRTDPAATIVCPSMGELWQKESREFLVQFAALGGYRNCDVAGVKLHPRDFGQPPETIFELTTLIDQTFHDAGVHPRLWSTGTTYRIATASHLSETDARNYAVRMFLISLYARYERMYFYNWGGRKIPIVLQAEGGPPTTAARYVERLEQWLASARLFSCGHGVADGLPVSAWRCQFRLGSPAPRAETQVDIVWTSTGTATMTATSDGVRRYLDGGETPLRRGQRYQVGEEPTLIVRSAG